MKTYFIHNNADRTILEFMKNTNVINVNSNYKLDDDSIVVFYAEHNLNIIKKGNINIMLLKSPIVYTGTMGKYNFYLPTTNKLFETHKKNLGYKLLFPINIYQTRSTNWNSYYCGDMFYRKYKTMLSNIPFKRDSMRKASLVIYDDETELLKTCDDGKIFKQFTKNYIRNRYIHECKNTLTLGDKCMVSQKFDCFSSVPIKYIYVNNFYDKIIIKKDEGCFISRKGFNHYKTIRINEILKNTLNYFNNVSFSVNGIKDYEYSLLVKSDTTQTTTMEELLRNSEYHESRAIGVNSKKLADADIFNLYVLYGANMMYHMYSHLVDIETNYFDVLVSYIKKINIYQNQKLNQNKFIRVMGFWCGSNNYKLVYKDLAKYIQKNKHYFIQESVFLLSKNIVSYGGNQKTALQCYGEMMHQGYNVKLCCLTSADLVDTIDKNDIIKGKNIKNVIALINAGDYKFVIVNKLDEFIKHAHEIKIPKYFITHNHMDPVNMSIIKNKYLTKIFTVNQYHTIQMYEMNNNYVMPVTNYYNSMGNIPQKRISHTKWLNNILYIGRISKEKNIDMLLEAFQKFSIINNDVKLIIVGDGKDDIRSSIRKIGNINGRIKLVGRTDYEDIKYYLAHSDYMISTSCTEGLPFSFIESMSVGVPVISSNIIGCREVVKDMKRGFLYDFTDYELNKKCTDKWDIFKIMNLNRTKNVNNIVKALERAYSIKHEEWDTLSKNCHDYCKKFFDSKVVSKQNVSNMLVDNRCNIAVICEECDPFFKLSYKFIDIVNNLDTSRFKEYDIIVKLKSFDYLTERLSLQKTTNHANNRNIMFAMARLYKVRQEFYETDKCLIYDDDDNWIILNYPYRTDINMTKDITDIISHIKTTDKCAKIKSIGAFI